MPPATSALHLAAALEHDDDDDALHAAARAREQPAPCEASGGMTTEPEQQVTLVDSQLWGLFYANKTEMIINRSGRSV